VTFHNKKGGETMVIPSFRIRIATCLWQKLRATVSLIPAGKKLIVQNKNLVPAVVAVN
jgi:hypothetical protein